MKRVVLYIIGLAFTFAWIYFWGMSTETTTTKFVLVLTSTASIIGVVISIIELVGVKSKAEAINESVAKTKEEISKYVNYADVKGMTNIIDEIEAHLHADKYESALLKMKELKDKVSEYHGYIKNRKDKEVNLIELTKIIQKIGIDVNTLHNNIDENGVVDKETIFMNLENTKDVLSKVSGQLKAKNYGT